MMFLNLSLAQFLTLFTAVTAFSVALYLLDRTRRKQVVATLRFWVVPGQPAPVTRRRKIQQPLSLLLQLLGMALLLLALAEFQLGGRESLRRNHVIVLDTSAWMSAQAPGAQAPGRPPATLMDLARANAIAWLRAVPSADRVMLIRADGLATPATAWEQDHRNIIKAILQSQPGATALNLSQSLVFAAETQRAASGVRDGPNGAASTSGEIVYVGPGRLTAREANNLNLPRLPALRVIPVNDDVGNIGLRSIGARPNSGAWEVVARIHNYTRSQQAASVTLAFGGAPEGTRTVVIPAESEQEVSFTVPTRAAGVLEARLYPKDNFLADNYAALEIPQMRTVHAIVYSDQPDRLRPALASDPRVTAEFHPTSDFQPRDMRLPAALLILDRFRPQALPAGNILWIDPPSGPGSAVIREIVEHPKEISWTPGHPVTAGLRVRDLQIDRVSVFDPAPADIRLASIDKGPIMIASVSPDGKSRVITLGFDPFAPSLRYELATPLLLANILRWMEPEVFRDIDVGTQSAGSVASPVTAEQAQSNQRSALQVLSETGANLPFNVRDRQVEFFSGDASRVRVIAGNNERVYSLTLPEMWDVKWTPPATVRHGVPTLNDSLGRTPDLWPFLAALGVALLLAEWFVYGRHSTAGLEITRPRLGRAA